MSLCHVPLTSTTLWATRKQNREDRRPIFLNIKTGTRPFITYLPGQTAEIKARHGPRGRGEEQEGALTCPSRLPHHNRVTAWRSGPDFCITAPRGGIGSSQSAISHAVFVISIWETVVWQRRTAAGWKCDYWGDLTTKWVHLLLVGGGTFLCFHRRTRWVWKIRKYGSYVAHVLFFLDKLFGQYQNSIRYTPTLQNYTNCCKSLLQKKFLT